MGEERVGVFGGSFDPVHNGHVAIAVAARDKLRLDVLYVVPAGLSPHKRKTRASLDHRIAMLRLSFGGLRGVRVLLDEARRGGRSYTVDTLRAVKRRRPGARLFLVLGSDAAAEFPRWREPDEIARLATPVVVERPGVRVPRRFKDARFDAPLLDVSSTGVRRMIARRLSIDGLVPREVARYIFKHKLYT